MRDDAGPTSSRGRTVGSPLTVAGWLPPLFKRSPEPTSCWSPQPRSVCEATRSSCRWVMLLPPRRRGRRRRVCLHLCMRTDRACPIRAITRRPIPRPSQVDGTGAAREPTRSTTATACRRASCWCGAIVDQSLGIDGGAVDDAPYQIEAPASTRTLPTSVVGGPHAMGARAGPDLEREQEHDRQQHGAMIISSHGAGVVRRREARCPSRWDRSAVRSRTLRRRNDLGDFFCCTGTEPLPTLGRRPYLGHVGHPGMRKKDAYRDHGRENRQ